MGLYDFTLYDVITRNSRLFENQPAWLDVGQETPLTFGEIKSAVDGLALTELLSGPRFDRRVIESAGVDIVEILVRRTASAAA